MAELALGIGTSHSPMLSLDAAGWLEWGEGDRNSPYLVDGVGRSVTWQQRVDEVGDRFEARISLEACEQAQRRMAVALKALAQRVASAELDTIVVIGDDQYEHLHDSNLPSLLVYWGESVVNHRQPDDDAPPVVRQYRSGYYEEDHDRTYPVNVVLARHLIDTMLDHSIDVASANDLPVAGRTVGHAFAFPLRRVVPSGVDIVPVMINTYNPPTQPRVKRCLDYGNAIRAAIESWDDPRRVGVLASGGLSHMLVLEDLDEMIIDSFERSDLQKIVEIPEAVLQSGTSEVKNWLTVAAACRDLRFELVDYVPGYRSRAGSGVGLTFALWR